MDKATREYFAKILKNQAAMMVVVRKHIQHYLSNHVVQEEDLLAFWRACENTGKLLEKIMANPLDQVMQLKTKEGEGEPPPKMYYALAEYADTVALFVVDKKVWDEQHRLDDTIDSLMRETLFMNGFAELEECMFEYREYVSENPDILEKTIRQKVEVIGLIPNDEFQKFIEDSMEDE